MNRSEYVLALRHSLGIHTDQHGFWLSWCLAESGTEPCDGHSGARWNPLNTTWNLPGSSLFNSAGVRNYPTSTAGIIAVTSTLRLSYYRELLAACKRGDSLGHCANLLQHSPWGTGSAIWAGIDAYRHDPVAAGRIRVGP